MDNKLIKINLNQTISRFELVEIKKEKNKWIMFSVFCGLFCLILLFNYLILNQYHDLISSRIEDSEKLLSDSKIIRSNYENSYYPYKIKLRHLQLQESSMNSIHL